MDTGMENFLISEELKKANGSLLEMGDKISKIEAALLPNDDNKQESVVDLLKVICYYFSKLEKMATSFIEEDDDDVHLHEEGENNGHSSNTDK